LETNRSPQKRAKGDSLGKALFQRGKMGKKEGLKWKGFPNPLGGKKSTQGHTQPTPKSVSHPKGVKKKGFLLPERKPKLKGGMESKGFQGLAPKKVGKLTREPGGKGGNRPKN